VVANAAGQPVDGFRGQRRVVALTQHIARHQRLAWRRFWLGLWLHDCRCAVHLDGNVRMALAVQTRRVIAVVADRFCHLLHVDVRHRGGHTDGDQCVSNRHT